MLCTYQNGVERRSQRRKKKNGGWLMSHVSGNQVRRLSGIIPLYVYSPSGVKVIESRSRGRAVSRRPILGSEGSDGRDEILSCPLVPSDTGRPKGTGKHETAQTVWPGLFLAHLSILSAF